MHCMIYRERSGTYFGIAAFNISEISLQSLLKVTVRRNTCCIWLGKALKM